MRRLRVAVMGILLLAPPASARACTVTLETPPSRLREWRVAEFDLRVRHGAVTNIATLFPGWRFAIRNGTNHTATAYGRALTSAGILHAPRALRLFSVTPQPGCTCQALERRHDVRLTVGLYRVAGDVFQRFLLTGRSIRIGR